MKVVICFLSTPTLSTTISERWIISVTSDHQHDVLKVPPSFPKRPHLSRYYSNTNPPKAFLPPPQSCPHLQQKLRSPSSQSCQYQRARREDLEPQNDLIHRRLEDAVHDTKADIAPSQPHRSLVISTQQRQRQRDRVEVGWLLH